jgi:hypothetical protein
MKDKLMSAQAEKNVTDAGNIKEPDEQQKDLDVYPLRDASEDPRWAVRTVWIWVGMALFLLLFLLTLFILGLWFD